MEKVQLLEVNENDVDQRVDNYLMRILKGVPKSYIYRMIREGRVRVNKKRVQPASRLQPGDVIRVPPMRTGESSPTQATGRLVEVLLQSILYENDAFMVLNKPAGLAVHGGSGIQLGVIEVLRQARTDLTYLELAHRLDRDTSGCLLLAKKRSVLTALQALFTKRDIKKTYWALLHGKWHGKPLCYVDQPLLKNTLHSGERIVRIDEEGKASKTRFVLLANTEFYCLVEASPKTGRTHQIRVHSTFLGHPIVGDAKYMVNTVKSLPSLPSRLYLHARAIQFTLDNQRYEFVAKLDDRFMGALTTLSIHIEQ